MQHVELQVHQVGVIDDRCGLRVTGGTIRPGRTQVFGLHDLFIDGLEARQARLALEELQQRVARDAMTPTTERIRLVRLEAMRIAIDVEEHFLQHVLGINTMEGAAQVALDRVQE